VAYIHSKGVVHGDLGLHNFLLHDDGRLILCDFAGSGLDDLPPNVSAGVRYLNPLFDSDYPSERDDVFALGTVLYELDRGERLFDGKSDQEIRQYLRNKLFPDLSLVPSPLRQVIGKCWKTPDYKTSKALIELGKYITISLGRTNLSTESQPSLIINTSFSGLLGLTVGAVGAVLIFKLIL
jgi:serine/threonine protein kinase